MLEHFKTDKLCVFSLSRLSSSQQQISVLWPSDQAAHCVRLDRCSLVYVTEVVNIALIKTQKQQSLNNKHPSTKPLLPLRPDRGSAKESKYSNTFKTCFPSAQRAALCGALSEKCYSTDTDVRLSLHEEASRGSSSSADVQLGTSSHFSHNHLAGAPRSMVSFGTFQVAFYCSQCISACICVDS